MEETIRMPLRFELWGKRITEHREREMLRETLCLSVWEREQERERERERKRERLSCCLASFRCLGSISMQLYLYNKSPSFRLSSLFSVHCNYKRKGRNSMGPAKLSYFHHTGESRIFSNYFSLGLPYFKLAQPLGGRMWFKPSLLRTLTFALVKLQVLQAPDHAIKAELSLLLVSKGLSIVGYNLGVSVVLSSCLMLIG